MLGLLRRLGLGRRLLRDRSPLVATFYAQAILADAAGIEGVWLVVTDADVNRVWVPADPASTRIGYLAPCARTARRLRDYGVPLSRIRVTGFPLPPSLVGGRGLEALDRNLASRLKRLEPPWSGGPPTVTFCVGGSGAQANLGVRAIPAFRPFLERGDLRLALVAGVHGEAARAFRRAGEGVPGLEVLEARDFAEYEPRFNELLARTDVLWTKPGELVFFAALGLPLLLAPPLGVHERRNRRMALHGGFALDGRDPAEAPARILEALRSGRLADAARKGRARLPARGVYRILDVVAGRA
jgi:UDP-N-acetylglucosamine:LPS N-acetylglucosamine transferase